MSQLSTVCLIQTDHFMQDGFLNDKSVISPMYGNIIGTAVVFFLVCHIYTDINPHVHLHGCLF
jgi:hypothetical protein